MSEGTDDVCGLSEVIETEQVVEILEESQFLDLAASMETRGEVMEAGTSSPREEREERRYLAGRKRKRGYNVCFDRLFKTGSLSLFREMILEEHSVLDLPLPTAVVPPSRQVIATPLSSQPQPLPPPTDQPDATNAASLPG